MTEENNYYAVILAGGGGTRLWPLSRKEKPKQMLQLFGEKTLFQNAVHRLENLFSNDHILVVTNKDQAKELQKQCPQLIESNFLLEPEPKGTAPAIGLAASYLQKLDPEAVMAVLTADHYIGNETAFIQYLSAAKDLALRGHLVTLGIEASYSATQYGYIQQGAPVEKINDLPAYHVEKFKEKPQFEEAQEMLAKGGYTWNSGMFIWQLESIINEFQSQIPDTLIALQQIIVASGDAKKLEIDAELWGNIAPETIDFGIMEKAKNVAVIPTLDLQWNDVGSWNSLFEVLEPDKDGNVILADQQISLDSKNSLVHTNGQRKMVVTIGVQDLVVVDTGDVLLICSKEQAQDVRQIIELLKKNKLNRYL